MQFLHQWREKRISHCHQIDIMLIFTEFPCRDLIGNQHVHNFFSFFRLFPSFRECCCTCVLVLVLTMMKMISQGRHSFFTSSLYTFHLTRVRWLYFFLWKDTSLAAHTIRDAYEHIFLWIWLSRWNIKIFFFSIFAHTRAHDLFITFIALYFFSCDFLFFFFVMWRLRCFSFISKEWKIKFLIHYESGRLYEMEFFIYENISLWW